MSTYSHSRISTFEQCRLRFKLQYLDKVPVEQEDTVETFLGSLVHEALEKLYKDLQFAKKLSLDELLAWFRAEWARRWQDSIAIVREEYTPENYRAMGERYLTDYYRRHEPFDQGRTLGLETQELLPLDDTHHYHIRIDRLVDAGNGVYEVHDYKTSLTLKTPQELAEDRQLAMYALWVYTTFPDATLVRLVWHYLAFDKDLVVEKQRDELEQVREAVLARIADIEAAQDYPPTRSALCAWCPYQQHCPLWKHLFATAELPPEEFRREDGVRLVDEYVRLKEEERILKEKLAEVQEQLFRYAEQHGVSVVYGATQKATIWRRRVVKVPGKNDEGRAAFEQLVRENGLWNDYSMLDAWRLEKDLAAGNVTIVGWEPRETEVKRIYLSRR